MMNPTTQQNRRQFLWEAGGGLGGIALAGLLANDGLLAGMGETAGPGVGVLHFPAKAKRVVQLFSCCGQAGACVLSPCCLPPMDKAPVPLQPRYRRRQGLGFLTQDEERYQGWCEPHCLASSWPVSGRAG